MEKQTGFLLSYFKYGDNDAVLHCYTKEAGFQSFFLRGLYSAKNKKKAFLSPLNEIDITISSPKNNLNTVKKIEMNEHSVLELSVHQNSIVFFVADFLNQILKNEHQNQELYQEIVLFKKSLTERKFHAHYVFLIKILRFFGVSPLVTEDKFLDFEKGIFQELPHKNQDENISEIWKNVIENKIDYSYAIEKKVRKNLLDSILLYYKIHFPDFYTPKSLPVILEIFE